MGEFDFTDGDEMYPLGHKEIKGKTGVECLEEVVEWVWSMPIPSDDKFTIETELRRDFQLNPKLFDGLESVDFAMKEVDDDAEGE